MKTKLTLALVLSFVLVLFVAGNAFAIKIVSYDDTASEVVREYCEGEDCGAGSLICNGNFDEWEGGVPVCWNVVDVPKSGWEEDHLANVNLAEIGDTAAEVPFNDGLGLFVRNIGGSGPHFIYAYNELTDVTASGYYWVEVQATMWGYYDQIQYTDPYFGDNSLLTEDGMTLNSVAFYGIGHVADEEAGPMYSDVSEWRELFPVGWYTDSSDLNPYVDDTDWEYHAMDANKWVPGVVPCANPWEACYFVGRMETIWIDADSTPYFWLAAGQKFSTFNVWTVFVMDDILVMEAPGADYDGSMHDIDGAIGWDEDEAR
jgi:hypothetical protein